jgi:hypothetical protein
MKQPSHTFYAFVDGFDLDEVAAQLSQELSTFVLGDGWRWQQPAVVNQRHERTPDLGPDDLPTWELGLTFPLPEPGSGRKDWFADVERIASFLGGLHAKTGLEFVLGIWDSRRRISEDLFFVESDRPDLEGLLAIMGMADAGQ